MNRPGQRLHKWAPLAKAVLLGTVGNARAQENKPQPQEFAKVEYLFGPTARQSREKLPGEVVTGTLRFDSSSKVLSFITAKGPSLSIPYGRIQDLALNDQSLMRSGALLSPALAPFLHQHKHFMTVRYTDENGGSCSALFQLDKGNYKGIAQTADKEIARRSEKQP